MSEWERYERLVARLISDQLSTAYCVSPNVRIVGKISGRKRQVDLLIDSRHDAVRNSRIVVDAKARGRPVDIIQVEAFLGLMADVAATHGYLVCPKGHTKAAGRRAQDAISIRLLPLDRLEDFDPSTWPKCQVQGCTNGLIFWDGYPAVDVALAPVRRSGPLANLTYVHYVGKCDRCSIFHVRCQTCGDLFDVPTEGDGIQCSCRMPWFWLASVETDVVGDQAAELHLVRSRSHIWTVNRRSL